MVGTKIRHDSVRNVKAIGQLLLQPMQKLTHASSLTSDWAAPLWKSVVCQVSFLAIGGLLSPAIIWCKAAEADSICTWLWKTLTEVNSSFSGYSSVDRIAGVLAFLFDPREGVMLGSQNRLALAIGLVHSEQ